MSLLDSFADLMTGTAAVYTIGKTVVNDEPTDGAPVLRASYPCYFFRGAMSTVIPSEKFRDQVDGTFIFYPDFVINQDTEYITYDGENYKPVFADDVADQGELIVLGARKA